ncbi:MAG: histidine--tRNA ligase, partial [bacterium]
EFYQCDVDTVGTESMLADAETIAIIYDVLTTLGFKKFSIRINNRKVLNGILNYAGVDSDKGTSVFIAIDKLDKIGKNGVKKELNDKGISNTAVNKIFSILEISGQPEQVLTDLSNSFSAIDTLQKGTEELKQILTYLDDLSIPRENFKIDLYLVRGLGYYTGPIYESVVEEPNIGSLSGGGRYDKLIGLFLGRDIPATGVAFGIERIIDVMAQLEMFPALKTKTDVLVTLFDRTTLQASLTLTQQFRSSGINAEHFFELTKIKKQFAYANRKKIPFVAIIGPDELATEQVTIKNMKTGKQQQLQREKVLEYLKKVKSK